MTHVEGPVLIVAGPGSGKTRVLIHRIKYLVDKAAIDPSSILTITFTRAAALEMQSRASVLLGDRAASISFSTFHSCFLSILRHTYRFTSDNIITNREQIELVHEVLQGLHIELRDLAQSVPDILSDISRVKCGNLELDTYESPVLDKTQFSELFERYLRRMNDLKKIDFDDMTLRCLSLFEERPNVLRKWRERYRYILIDEFQDIDPMQFMVVKHLAAPLNNLFAVGDDDQSIYGFRGSDPSIMRDFKEVYRDAAIIHLSTNYRSLPAIVSAAGKVISVNQNRIEKEIVSGREKAHAEWPPAKTKAREVHRVCGRSESIEGDSDTSVGEAPLRNNDRNGGFYFTMSSRGFDKAGSSSEILDLREFRDEEKQYEALKEALLSPERPLNSIAILLRTNTLISNVSDRLSSWNLPFRCKDRIVNIYDHFIARDVLDYLRVASGVTLRSTMYRIMNHPYRMISRNAVSGENFSFGEMKRYHAHDPKAYEAICKLEKDIGRMRDMKPYAAIHYLYSAIGYLKHLKDYAAHKGISYDELSEVAFELKERARGFRSFSVWLDSIEDYRRELGFLRMAEKGEKDPEREAVTLMTLHGSKGLEFEEVFLLNVNEGVIPYRRAVLQGDIEEERRLFYVGMTRAKDRLHIWHTLDHYGKRQKPSRFLEGLERDLCCSWSAGYAR